MAAFEAALHTHVAIAKRCGPYKISVHSGSDKFAVYPILGRVCGDLLHVKTAGTSYLEALRVAARMAPELFVEIVSFARRAVQSGSGTYHVSAGSTTWTNRPGCRPTECEERTSIGFAGRQIYHSVRLGTTLGRTLAGQRFKDALLQLLAAEPELHRQVLAAHLGKHLRLLEAG